MDIRTDAFEIVKPIKKPDAFEEGIPTLEGLIFDVDKMLINIKYLDKISRTIIFDNVIASRVCQERFQIDTLTQMNDQNLLGHFLYEIHNSRFIGWVSNESMDTSDDIAMTHIRLMTLSHVVDVICVSSHEDDCAGPIFSVA